MEEARKVIAQNRKAHFNYTVTDSLECGIVLEGSEVKSVKAGSISFGDSFAYIERGEVFLQNFHIAEYSFSSIFNHDPDRKKKLLLHKDEIKRLQRKTDEKGFTLVPLEIYLKNGLVKIKLGLCKGKKEFDKRASIKDRDVKREIAREFKSRQNG
ncbi:MAG: SsrA-binding protein SmpB [Treponema sp.]|nr:SsrA-binding protein SmpB [Treponema sp.]